MTIFFVTLFALISVFGFAKEQPLLDLEAMAQDFVLETRKIEIPGYPFAFNPAIIRWRGQLIMSFRIIPDRRQSFNTELGIVVLNEQFEPISTPQLLYLRDESSPAPCRAEDIRFLAIGERLFLIYDDNEDVKLSKGGFRMYVAELYAQGDHFVLGDVECLRHFEGQSQELREKSWVPFEYQGHLLLAYSLIPHKILFPRLDGSGICDTVATTESSVAWDFGTLRGGTQALLKNGQYLAFFHSSTEMATVHSGGKNITHYFIGAYTFAASPPFAITAVSPEPIIGEHFYSGIVYKPYWKPIRCVFPCGYIADERHMWIAYGREDHECWVAKIDTTKLLKSLVKLDNPSIFHTPPTPKM